MGDVVLPLGASNSGSNDWSDVHGEDQAIVDVVNGNIDADNLAANAVTTAKILDGAVTNAKVDSSAAIAGSKLDTIDGRLKQTVGFVVATGDLNPLTTSYVDVPGATVTFTPDVACYALVQVTFDFVCQTDVTGSNVTSGVLVVDGTPQGRIAYLGMTNNNAAHISTTATATQTYRIALSAASHTLKLQAKKSAADSAACFLDNTNFSYQLTAQ
jgi:hypothetical protein